MAAPRTAQAAADAVVSGSPSRPPLSSGGACPFSLRAAFDLWMEAPDGDALLTPPARAALRWDALGCAGVLDQLVRC